MNINKKKEDIKYIAIDLGTSSTKVFIKGEGIVFNEATLIAYDSKTNAIAGIGNKAKKLVGKTQEKIMIKYPLKNGVMTDVKLTQIFIQEIFKEKGYEKIWKNAYVLITCPVSITNMERNALKIMCDNLGAQYSEIQDDIKLALMGCGCDIYDSKGRLILDIGSGKSTAGIIAAGEVVISSTIKEAGNHIDNEIKKFIKSHYTVIIGNNVAEKIKNELVSLTPENNGKEMLIYGSDISSNLPKEIFVTGKELHELVISALKPIVDLLSGVLANAPAEIMKDIISDGINLVGGVSQLKGIKQFFKDCFKMNVKICPNAALANINGSSGYEKKLINNYKGIYNELSFSKDSK